MLLDIFVCMTEQISAPLCRWHSLVLPHGLRQTEAQQSPAYAGPNWLPLAERHTECTLCVWEREGESVQHISSTSSNICSISLILSLSLIHVRPWRCVYLMSDGSHPELCALQPPAWSCYTSSAMSRYAAVWARCSDCQCYPVRFCYSSTDR